MYLRQWDHEFLIHSSLDTGDQVVDNFFGKPNEAHLGKAQRHANALLSKLLILFSFLYFFSCFIKILKSAHSLHWSDLGILKPIWNSELTYFLKVERCGNSTHMRKIESRIDIICYCHWRVVASIYKNLHRLFSNVIASHSYCLDHYKTVFHSKLRIWFASNDIDSRKLQTS